MVAAVMLALAGLTLATTAPAWADLNTTGTVDSGDLTQDGRVSRDDIQSTCAALKANPGPLAMGTSFHYDAYHMTATPGACVTVTLTLTSASGNLLAVAYAPTFNPAAPATNYLADPGRSAVPDSVEPNGSVRTFSFLAPASGSFVVVISQADTLSPTATYSLTVTQPAPRLTITKTCGPPTTALPGDTVSCTITVSNTGTADATGVSFTDQVAGPGTLLDVTPSTGNSFACGPPSANTVTCTGGQVPAGQSATFHPHVQVNSSASEGAQITNTATLGASTSSAVITVQRADLAVSKTCTPTPVVPTGTVNCQITVTNNGSAPAANVSVTDTAATGTTAQSSGGDFGACTLGSPTTTCTRALPLAPGETRTINLSFRVSENVGPNQPLTNTATATTTTPEVTTTNNTGTATVNTVACTITGTAGADIIQATRGNQVICGLGGDDYIVAKGTNNVIFGGAGNDIITGGSGNDIILGGAGDDTINGNGGVDQLFGNAGNDTLNAQDSAGGDIVNGGPGTADTCSADPGDTVSGCEL